MFVASGSPDAGLEKCLRQQGLSEPRIISDVISRCALGEAGWRFQAVRSRRLVYGTICEAPMKSWSIRLDADPALVQAGLGN